MCTAFPYSEYYASSDFSLYFVLPGILAITLVCQYSILEACERSHVYTFALWRCATP